MDVTTIENELRARVIAAAAHLFGVHLGTEDVVVEASTDVARGDIALPIAFKIAQYVRAQTGEKRLPRQIADELKSSLEKTEGVERIQVAPSGYINVFLDRLAVFTHAALPFLQEARDRIPTTNEAAIVSDYEREFQADGYPVYRGDDLLWRKPDGSIESLRGRFFTRKVINKHGGTDTQYVVFTEKSLNFLRAYTVTPHAESLSCTVGISAPFMVSPSVLKEISEQEYLAAVLPALEATAHFVANLKRA